MRASLIAVALLVTSVTAAAQPYRREIAPFAVATVGGDPLVNPFSGGLWQPRIGLRDVDGDGRIDLFTLNPDGELRMYRNEGSFRFRRIVPSPYDRLPTSNWFRFADLDGDGDAEILTGGPRSEVMVIDNAGTDAAPAFVPPRMLLNTSGDSIRTQLETVPSLVDIDADGDVDLFTGNVNGSISHYENVGTPSAPAFTLRSEQYMDILVLGENVPRAEEESERGSLQSGARHGASVLDFTDLDGDGDLDILFGDYFTTKMLLFTNTGTRTAASFGMDRLDTAFRPTGDDVESEGFNQPASGDLDTDGDLDVLVSTLHPIAAFASLTLFENLGTSTAPVMRRRSIDVTSELDFGTYAAPATIDDALRHGLLVGSIAGRLTYLERGPDGASHRVAATIPLPGLYQTVPATGDLDGDGIAEVVVGDATGNITPHRFDGNVLTASGEPVRVNRNASPALVDLDGDGDLDIFTGAENGRFAYFENAGSRTEAFFADGTPPAPFDSLDVGYDSAPRFFDIDADGDLDVIVGGRTGGARGMRDTLRFFVRDASGYTESPRFPPMAIARNPTPLGLRTAAATYLLVGDLSGGIKAFVDTTLVSGVDGVGERRRLSLAATRAAGRTTIEAGWNPVLGIELRGYDVRGVEVFARAVGDGDGRIRWELDDLAAGAYVVEARSGRERATIVVPIAE